MPRFIAGTWILVGLAGLLGCRAADRTPAPRPPVPVPVPASALPMAPGGAVIPPPAPVPGSPAPNPGAFPTVPGTSPAPNPAAVPSGGAQFYPPTQNPGFAQAQPGCSSCNQNPPTNPNLALAPQPNPATRVDFRWTPADPPPQNFTTPRAPQTTENRVQLGTPEPLTAEPPLSGAAKLLPPKVEEEPSNPKETPKNLFPVGIANFQAVQPGLSAGYRPNGTDGLDWLQSNQYKSVLYLRGPQDPDDADRREAEKRGLKYHTLEASPQTLSKKTLDEFLALVRENESRPWFVYDANGTLAGAFWYWYFRNVELDSDEVARIRARSLGLRETGDDAQRDIWLSLQKILSE